MAGVSGSLYISGCPGTGKTALLDEILRDMTAQLEDRVDVLKINCMTLTEPKMIYPTILKDLQHESRSAKDAAKVLEEIFVPKQKPKKQNLHLLIMDEVDSLLTRDSDVLYNLFEWAVKPGSRLVLIGIANALDLTERFLPRLTARNCAPQLLNFTPYEVAEIAEIIKNRLKDLEEPMDLEEKGENTSPKAGGTQEMPKKKSFPLMQPMAIELVARKMAATGDLRKALDVCRTAIEMVESESRLTDDSSIPNSPSTRRTPVLPPSKRLLMTDIANPIENLDEIPKVSVKHVMSATQSALGVSNVSRVKGLGLNQKMVLVTLVMCGRAKIGVLAVGKLYESYVTLCHIRKGHLVPVTRSEFEDLVTMLESTGFVSVKEGKKARSGIKDGAVKTVGLSVREDEVVKSCEEHPLLKIVLESGVAVLA
ncbi:AAA ATPase [Rhizophlyctis rosea]|uniref:AAA ATPase n=1 Tax=Rhizophlyctis rosea TaxID=64517 RepID=A0AAD5SIR6_9FUNG|nr:AAA ATPase [Rhizophlyctis rosea]